MLIVVLMFMLEVKYLVIIGAVSFVTLLSITLTYHVVVIYVYPIAISSLYFSKRLNVVATAMTVVGVSAGQIAAFFLPTVQDRNFTNMKDVMIFIFCQPNPTTAKLIDACFNQFFQACLH